MILNIPMKKIIFILFFTFFITPFVLMPIVEVGAQSNETVTGKIENQGDKKLTNPLGNVTSPQLLIGKIIDAILGVVGSLALLMFVYGGITWMTSAGNPEKVKKGTDILVWSAIGLVIIFSAYGLTRVLISGVAGN
ncbi:MAG: hypothetical protein PWQ35_406 [Patescibacteria group bacterium]|nr:hypothetical protein [Patescibacteria group bacterium]